MSGSIHGPRTPVRLAEVGTEGGRSTEDREVHQVLYPDRQMMVSSGAQGLLEQNSRIVGVEDIAGPVFSATGPAREDQGGSSAIAKKLGPQAPAP